MTCGLTIASTAQHPKSRDVKHPARPNRLRKNSVLRLILGGAAVYRCDKWLVFRIGFSRCGETAPWKVLFPQPARDSVFCG